MSLPLPPENFRYNSSQAKLLWDSVHDAEQYWIEFKPVNESVWAIAYQGPDTECDFNQQAGVYNVKGKSGKGTGWGVFGDEVEILV